MYHYGQVAYEDGRVQLYRCRNLAFLEKFLQPRPDPELDKFLERCGQSRNHPVSWGVVERSKLNSYKRANATEITEEWLHIM